MAARKPRQKQDIEKRREEILKAALDVFTQKGFEAATIPEIARAAGIAAGTIYLYYPSKHELFVAVIKDFVLTAPLLKMIDDLPKSKIEDTFKSILKERFKLLKNPAFSRIHSLIGEVQRDPELKELWLKDFLNPFLKRIEMVYRAGTGAGIIRRLEPEVIVRAVGGLIIGFLLLKSVEGEASPINKIDEETVSDNIATIILYGLLKNPKEDAK
jgi:AcrR family transcriptional regulator